MVEDDDQNTPVLPSITIDKDKEQSQSLDITISGQNTSTNNDTVISTKFSLFEEYLTFLRDEKDE